MSYPKHLYRGLALFCALLIHCVGLLAQTMSVQILPPVTICNYSQIGTDNGLSSNNVNVLFTDHTGLMWIGTDDGLNSYDGYNIRRYMPNMSDTITIEGKQIFGIDEFEPNVVTVAMGDGGINCYNKSKSLFLKRIGGSEVSDFDMSSAYGLCSVGDEIYFVLAECVLKQNVNTGNVYYIDLPTPLTTRNDKRARVRIDIMPGDRGEVAMLTDPMTLNILSTKYEVIHEKQFTNLYIYDICPYDEENLLLATSTGIWFYNIRTRILDTNRLLPNHSVQTINRSDSGNFWIAFDGNILVRWNPEYNTITPIANSEQMMNSQTCVNDIYEDQNGLLWIATSNNGLLKLDTKPQKIDVYYIENKLQRGYSTLDMSAVDADDIWAACGINGLVHIDMKNGKSSIFPMLNYNVSSVLARKNGSIFVGTSDGVMRYNSERRTMERLPIRENIADSVGNVMVRSISEDCLGNVWFCTNIGLYSYNGVSFKRATVEGNPICNFNCLTEDFEGRLWAGSQTSIYVRDINDDVFHIVYQKDNRRSDEGILCLTEYDNNMLVGSSEGIVAFDKETKERVPLKIESSFANKKIYSMVCDRNDIIWVSTSEGIAYADEIFNKVYIFDKRDGLYYLGNECHKFVAIDDDIFFGQVAAVNHINTQQVSFNTCVPKTFVSSVFYGQSGQEYRMKMENDSTYTSKYIVNGSVKMVVASSDYTNPLRNTFMYKIDDGEWITIEGSSEIVMPSFFPGMYKVMLRSANADKTWSLDTRTIFIRIETPLWASRPAIIFYAILIMSLVQLSLSLRFRKINRRVKQAEEEAKNKNLVLDQRNKLAKAIKDQKDSINAAKRIQDALMPKIESYMQYFDKLFVLYRPKDIVSGDFYMFYHRDGLTFVVSSDCTGHGVPGAFISILGIDHLNNIIMQQKVNDAGVVLTRLHAELHDAVKKMSTEEFNEGMDITICIINHAEKKINFAGAKNDLYLIRNNEVFIHRGERKSVGTNMSIDGDATILQEYHSVDIDCQNGDMMYLFSDGFTDQDGGPGKEKDKFKRRRFKNLLLNVHKLPASDQKILLNQKLEEWRGAEEQTDDISIIGFSPWA